MGRPGRRSTTVGQVPVYVQTLAASDTTYVAGGQTSDGGPFIWSAPQ